MNISSLSASSLASPPFLRCSLARQSHGKGSIAGSPPWRLVGTEAAQVKILPACLCFLHHSAVRFPTRHAHARLREGSVLSGLRSSSSPHLPDPPKFPS